MRIFLRRILKSRKGIGGKKMFWGAGAAANLLDTALKHTPAGGTVPFNAGPHFGNRRVAEFARIKERRRFRLPRQNSVEVPVGDSGPGIPRNITRRFSKILCVSTAIR